MNERTVALRGYVNVRSALRSVVSSLLTINEKRMRYRLTKVERSFYHRLMNKNMTNTREKILATAEELIYQNGIHATGMELLVKTSGVARKSIYHHFTNKDEVAAAALNARDVRWMAWFRRECDKAETPRERILNIFTVLKSWFESEGYRGCAFINTAGEVGDADNPVRQIARLHKQKLLDYLVELTGQLNADQPLPLARQLLILIEGAITMSRVMGDYRAADEAKDIAQLLLNQIP